MSSVQGGIKNLKKILRKIEDIQTASETVLKRTASDIKTRGPGWISSGITEMYGIKKSALPGKTGKAEAGTVRFIGSGIKDMSLVYTGQLLTPRNFGMTPKVPSQSYTLKAEIIKGNKAVLGKKRKLTKKQRKNIGRNFHRQGTQSSPRSPIMLMPTGSTYIPFQRKSQRRNDIEVIKTLSLPQMVTEGKNGALKPAVDKKFNEGLEKRLAQHMKLLQK